MRRGLRYKLRGRATGALIKWQPKRVIILGSTGTPFVGDAKLRSSSQYLSPSPSPFFSFSFSLSFFLSRTIDRLCLTEALWRDQRRLLNYKDPFLQTTMRRQGSLPIFFASNRSSSSAEEREWFCEWKKNSAARKILNEECNLDLSEFKMQWNARARMYALEF